MLNANVIKAKQSHIMIERQEQQSKDSEFNWTDRLKAWKSVQNAKGAIVDLGSKGKLNSNSASMAILRILQSDHKIEAIQETVENALIMSLRRSAGLNLLNFAMSFHGNEQIFFDMLQWFSGSLRENKSVSCHYLDGLACCGNKQETILRNQFF